MAAASGRRAFSGFPAERIGPRPVFTPRLLRLQMRLEPPRRRGGFPHPAADPMTDRVISAGRAFYGVGVAAIGVQHFVNGDFVAVIIPSFPAGTPGHAFVTHAAGASLFLLGVAIVLGVRARSAAVVLGTALLAAVALRGGPVQLAGNIRSLGAWANIFRAVTLSGGAFLVASTLPGKKESRIDRFFAAFGCFGLAITATIFGVDHFIYAGLVASLVPSWIPAHAFWTCFCGPAGVDDLCVAIRPSHSKGDRESPRRPRQRVDKRVRGPGVQRHRLHPCNALSSRLSGPGATPITLRARSYAQGSRKRRSKVAEREGFEPPSGQQPKSFAERALSCLVVS